MSGCGVALRRRLVRRLGLGRLVALRLALGLRLRLSLGIGLRIAFLIRVGAARVQALLAGSAVRLVPARALEDDRRHGKEPPRLLAAIGALLECLVLERLDR